MEQNTKLEKKYGLFTAICMVVGIVIGSGVFFKAQTILNKTEGNMPLGILAWVIGGIIMVICACTFGIMATKYSHVNGLVDYAEVTVGKKYAYFIGWFMSTIYVPAMTSVLAWVSARYFGELFGWSLNSSEVMVIGGLFLIGSYALNALSPKLAGKFQVSTTTIKLIPLILMAVVGTIYGLVKVVVSYEVDPATNEIIKNGTNEMQILLYNFKNAGSSNFGVLFAAVVSSAFAYEGWILATTINAEIKDAKKNLPLALFIGSIVIILVYIFYYIGVAGGATVDVLQNSNGGAQYSFLQIFGDVFGTILKVFIVISCLGTLNGLMLSCTRTMYSLATRNLGPNPDAFVQVDKHTNMPTNSAVLALLICGLWFVYFYGANLTSVSWFGKFSFDSSELPIITIYTMYIPILVMMIVKERKHFGVFKGIVMPVLAILSCLFMTVAAIYSHGIAVVYYLIIYVGIMLIGLLFLVIKSKNTSIEVQ